MGAARSPNKIIAVFAQKKQKLSSSPSTEKSAETLLTSTSASSQVEDEDKEVRGQVVDSPLQTYPIHLTYPFPIADLPSPQGGALLAPTSMPKVIKKGDLDLLYFEPFFTNSTASAFYKHLLESLPWYKVKYLARGMTIKMPRYTTVFGLDEMAMWDLDHRDDIDRGDLVAVARVRVLSAMSKQPVLANVNHLSLRPITPSLFELKRCVEDAIGESYNFVLVNFYADGSHSISPHVDDESFLGPSPWVASLNLGGTRHFVMKHKTTKKEMMSSSEKFALRNGDMVVMRRTTMVNWLHSVPQRVGKTQATSLRINITFWKVLNVKGSNNYTHYNVGSGPMHRFLQRAMVPMATEE